MSSVLSLTKPVQIVRKHWRYLGGWQIGSMQLFIKDALLRGQRCSEISMCSQGSLRHRFLSSVTQSSVGKAYFYFIFSWLLWSPVLFLCFA